MDSVNLPRSPPFIKKKKEIDLFLQYLLSRLAQLSFKILDSSWRTLKEMSLRDEYN